jgi:hypothetical protein
LPTNLGGISHNVKGLRRLGQVIRQCEALTPAPNVAEKKRTKALLRRLRFYSATFLQLLERFAFLYRNRKNVV